MSEIEDERTQRGHRNSVETDPNRSLAKSKILQRSEP